MNKEIIWNIVNCLLAGGLVFFGAFSVGQITINTFLYAFAAAAIVSLTQFKDYWDREKPEYINKALFSFVSF